MEEVSKLDPHHHHQQQHKHSEALAFHFILHGDHLIATWQTNTGTFFLQASYTNFFEQHQSKINQGKLLCSATNNTYTTVLHIL
jgi:hypothetical protein